MRKGNNMKKHFTQPTLRRYELNTKESIVASITYNDAFLKATWSFTYQEDADHNPVSPDEPNLGCFDYFFGDQTENMVTNGYLSSSHNWYTYLGHLTDTPDGLALHDRCSHTPFNP